MSGQREIPPPPQFGAPAPQVLQLMQPAKIEGRSKAEIIKDLDKKKNIKASVVSEGLRNKAFKRGKPPAKVSSELWKISSPLMKAKDNSYEPTNYIGKQKIEWFSDQNFHELLHAVWEFIIKPS